jgi:hypothetical protein
MSRRIHGALSGWLLGACCTLAACGNGGNDASSCPALSAACPTPPPSWKTDVQPIITTYCVSCHSPGGQAPSQFDYTTFAGVHQNSTEILTQVIQCLMPQPGASPMPAADRQTLVGWAACGAPNN